MRMDWPPVMEPVELVGAMRQRRGMPRHSERCKVPGALISPIWREEQGLGALISPTWKEEQGL